MEFEPVIGLEVHVQLKTRTKMFCRCPVAGPDEPANTSICPVCTGQPGVLPVTNLRAVEIAVKAGLALNCKVNEYSIFARKNYFYPDLPKAYQISQYEKPVCENGNVEIDVENGTKLVRIKRAHLEEDAGKSLHAIESQELDYTLVDFNRCGIPLLEIVSEPDMNSPDEAYRYLVELKRMMQWIGVSSCDMEKGELRVDVNVSVMPKGTSELGRKVEIKNLNSFKAVKDAISYEISRQIDAIKKGEKISQDTRMWSEKEQRTVSMRSKEMAHDYRYFPEPDLVPLIFNDKFIDEIKKDIGELPQKRKNRFINEFNLSNYDAEVLTSSREVSDYFEKCIKSGGNPKISSNLIATELTGRLNTEKIEIKNSPITPKQIAEVSVYLKDGKISSKIAKEVMDKLWQEPAQSPKEIIESSSLLQISDEKQIEQWVKEAIKEKPQAAQDFRSGNEKALSSLVGLVMKKSKGKANPRLTNSLLKELLKK
jgi:aspartyl-tRNA(Asn)/glutamyl-tRNA(Gln) amidotransferase subunit B